MLTRIWSRPGDWLSSAAALPAPAAAQGALWGSAPFARPGTSLYTSAGTDFSGASPAPESRCLPAHALPWLPMAPLMLSHEWLNSG